jgi:hypothetical protein
MTRSDDIRLLADDVRKAAHILEAVTRLTGRNTTHPERGLWSATGLRDVASTFIEPAANEEVTA